MQLRLEGLTYAEIGKMLNISRQRAQQLIRPTADVYQQLRERAQQRCESCGEIERAGHAHHIDVLEEDHNNLNNLEYLCIDCHLARHGKGSAATAKEMEELKPFTSLVTKIE